MKAILILLAMLVCFSFVSFNTTENVNACFGCECTNSCDDDPTP